MRPELIKIGPFTLYTYGLMWMVGIWLAVWRALRHAPRYGIRQDDVLDIAFWSVALGIVGGRLAFVLTNWSQYASDPLSVFRVWEGGMSYFGGFGLAIAVAIYLIRKRRIPIWQLGDLAAPSLALGYGIARIGCFAAGCCYGAPTDLPWGVVFPGHDHAVHPTQLYATAMNLLIFAVLIAWAQRRQFEGQLFAGFLILHGLYRFLNEFFRAGATSQPMFGVFTYGHLVAAVVVLSGVVLYVVLARRASAPRAAGAAHRAR
ncbi:MAG: prolipoprotein diacylglyceryl transferase [Armatimonadetes bacterium CP1_7O]|nr:MAG: prolipoprotein diacylglyceryl transferase [Armatimonadetes bacterium CP1_7O]